MAQQKITNKASGSPAIQERKKTIEWFKILYDRTWERLERTEDEAARGALASIILHLDREMQRLQALSESR